MIKNVTGYGVMLTSEFGDALSPYKNLVKMIHEYYRYEAYLYHSSYNDEYDEYDPDYDYDYLADLIDSPWLCTCPTAGEYQLVLGFEAAIGKKTDFKELDKLWYEVLEQLPENIKLEVKKLELGEPDVVEMSGKY